MKHRSAIISALIDKNTSSCQYPTIISDLPSIEYASARFCFWCGLRMMERPIHLDPFKHGPLNLCVSCHACPLLVLPCVSLSNMCASWWLSFHVYNSKCFWKAQRMFEWVHDEFICFSETKEDVKIEFEKTIPLLVSWWSSFWNRSISMWCFCYCWCFFFLHIYVC